jgi:hypothetical protein
MKKYPIVLPHSEEDSNAPGIKTIKVNILWIGQ